MSTRLTSSSASICLITETTGAAQRRFALGFTALHTLVALQKLLPRELLPPIVQRLGLVACAIFYFTISGIAFAQQWPKVHAWLTGG